jgi:signal transduction histidine kinase
MWHEGTGELLFTLDGVEGERPLVDSLCKRAFAERQPVFSDNPIRDNPTDTSLYERYALKSVLAAPIVAGAQPLGVLGVYATHTPIFAEDDLHLVQLLADQAAVILESRALIDEAARVQAREEATRLKDDFLSAAAHDLRTPLTALIARAQLLEHRARRNPQAPADRAGLQQVVEDAKRLAQLVTELLDVGRAEQGKLVGNREEIDLVSVVRAAAALHSSPRHPCTLDAEDDVRGLYDPIRVRQLIDNLLENAIKYSPQGGSIRMKIWREGDRAHLTVTDEGIGIPAGELGHLFDRFHRGSNVDDRRFVGMGLGLYICKNIAEQHGGRLWATSPGPNQGSTFHLDLPAVSLQPVASVVPEQVPSRSEVS